MRILGCDLQRPIEIGDGAVRLSLYQQRPAAKHAGEGIVLVQRNRPIECSDRPLSLTANKERHTAPCKGHLVIRTDLQRPIEIGGRFRRTPFENEGKATAGKRIGTPWSYREGLIKVDNGVVELLL
jgi:hypothetical protein